MSNLIVIAVLLLIVAWAVKESVKHLHGEGGCCGGGSCERSAKPEKKKLDGPVLHSYDFEVEGMHCEHCAAKVTSAINAIDGAAANVSLRKKHAHVDCDRDIAPATIIAAVAREGYAVKEISGEMK